MLNAKLILFFTCTLLLFKAHINAMHIKKKKEEKPKYSFLNKLWNGSTKIITIPKNTPLLLDSNGKNIVTYYKNPVTSNLSTSQVNCPVFEHNDYEDILYQSNGKYLGYSYHKKYTGAKVKTESDSEVQNTQGVEVKHSFKINDLGNLVTIQHPSKIFYPEGLSKDIQVTRSGGFTLERATLLLTACVAIAYRVNKLLD